MTNDQFPIPSYSYVPGRFPHPVRNPQGHSFGREVEPVTLPGDGDWRRCREYLRGIELFNRGYYWEAHECWEAVWIALGRRGRDADFLKGLIKLAAAGVKAREGRPEGVARHARRAAELFRDVASGLSDGATAWGMRLAPLIQAADTIYRQPQNVLDDSPAPISVVFPFSLDLESF